VEGQGGRGLFVAGDEAVSALAEAQPCAEAGGDRAAALIGREIVLRLDVAAQSVDETVVREDERVLEPLGLGALLETGRGYVQFDAALGSKCLYHQETSTGMKA